MRIVNSSGVGRKTNIYIDDIDVSSCFSAVRITVDSESPVTAEMEAIVCEVDIDGVSCLRMPMEGTRELLIRHGWTAPAETSVSTDDNL